MNSKKKLIITAAAFVIIIIVAVIAYNTLKSRTGAGNLNPLGNHAQTETSSDTQKDSAQDDSASGDAQKGGTQSGTPAESETEANPIPEFSMTDANGKTVSISMIYSENRPSLTFGQAPVRTVSMKCPIFRKCMKPTAKT